MPRDDDKPRRARPVRDDEDDGRRSARRHPVKRLGWTNRHPVLTVIAFFATVLIVVLMTAGCFIAYKSLSDTPRVPTESVEGIDWTYRELFRHLNAAGIACDYTVRIDPDTNVPINAIGSVGPVDFWVQACATRRDARDMAQVQQNGFAWGRFVFWCHGHNQHRDLLDRVQRSLPR